MTTTVRDVMTRCPISVPVDAPFQTVAAVLSRNLISAVPVVDRHGLPVGVVSEADLIDAPAARTARDLMTSPIGTVAENATLPTASRLLVDTGVRRLFVTEHGRLVGVLSRRDLLKSYLVDDVVVREHVHRALLAVLPDQRCPLTVSVDDGVVLLLGRVEWRSSRAVVDQRVQAVPGVVEVLDRLGYVFDDGPRPRLAGSVR
jgi:CBS-domain-containing membrane protein